jgi:hypothetical protein
MTELLTIQAANPPVATLFLLEKAVYASERYFRITER